MSKQFYCSSLFEESQGKERMFTLVCLCVYVPPNMRY
jgi:hypothetical protein